MGSACGGPARPSRTACIEHRREARRADRSRRRAREIVDYLLFVNEAPLIGEIRGSSGYAERFAAQGPRDRKGRSLRQLDLHRRLMRYPCSFLIYAPVFEQLPHQAKAAVYQRMWTVLSGEDKAPRYGALSRSDRQAIVEILRDTKDDLPAYFHSLVN